MILSLQIKRSVNIQGQTSLAARAIDAMDDVAARTDVRTALLKYLDTDTVWYFFSFFAGLARPFDPPQFSFHQDYPDPLVRLQDEHWNPLLAWARNTFNIELCTSQSVLFSTQPDATKKKLDKALQKLDSWQMAGCVSFRLIPFMKPDSLIISHGQRWSAPRIQRSHSS